MRRCEHRLSLLLLAEHDEDCRERQE